MSIPVTAAAQAANAQRLAACAAQLSQHLTSARLSAVCAPVAVAIGIIVTYLTLDRFRYHHRLLRLLEGLGKLLEPVEKLVALPDGQSFTQVEKNYLALHYYCGHQMAVAFVEKGDRKSQIFNGGLDSKLSLIVRAIMQLRVDRKLSGLVCAFLCIWELVISYILFKRDDPPQWLDSNWATWLPFVAIVLAYLVPVIGFGIGEYTVKETGMAVRRWIEEETTRQARAAEAASLGQVSSARRRKRAAD